MRQTGSASEPCEDDELFAGFWRKYFGKVAYPEAPNASVWEPPLLGGVPLRLLLDEILELLLVDDPADLESHMYRFYNNPDKEWVLIGDKDNSHFTVSCGTIGFEAKGPCHVWASLHMDWTEVQAYLLDKLGNPAEFNDTSTRWRLERRDLLLRNSGKSFVYLEMNERAEGAQL